MCGDVFLHCKQQERPKLRKELICKTINKNKMSAVTTCFSGVWKWWKKVWCNLNYIRHNFSYVWCSFSYIKCNFSGIGFAPFVGAYCTRPLHHRMNRNANRPTKLHNPRNSGRMPYAPTVMQFTIWQYITYFQSVLHSSCMPRREPRCKSAQIVLNPH